MDVIVQENDRVGKNANGKVNDDAEGERPDIVENTPQYYVDLMKKYWNEDRPSSKEVLKIEEMRVTSYQKNTSINETLCNMTSG
ncbi:hypothetical protein RhiirA5_423418 [Rhizophagus irregularis]|uniref:Uncharacterized protein n=1 Tax=Rhizophagus irregularis TaxID=588596 RepID=A0A2N0PA01_9GLOM|nr:hypothetical protein RhiirA5_423418 [Rhizophagus irregularis]